MNMYESSSDRPESAGELSHATGPREYSGPLPDLTIGNEQADNASNTRGTKGHRDRVAEPSVAAPDLVAPERTAAAASASRPTETAEKIGGSAASASVEVSEPTVSLPHRPRDRWANKVDVPFDAPKPQASPEPHGAKTHTDQTTEVTTDKTAKVVDASSKAPMSGLLEPEKVAEFKDKYRMPNDVAPGPDTAESTGRFRIPNDVVVARPERWVRETDPGDQPAATGVEVIPTAAIAHEIPPEMRAEMVPTVREIEPASPVTPQSPRTIEGTVVAEPEVHTEATPDPGASEADPTASADMAPGTSWPEELAVITRDTVVAETPVRGTYTPESSSRTGSSGTATETTPTADSHTIAPTVEQGATPAETTGAQDGATTTEATNPETTTEATHGTTEVDAPDPAEETTKADNANTPSVSEVGATPAEAAPTEMPATKPDTSSAAERGNTSGARVETVPTPDETHAAQASDQVHQAPQSDESPRSQRTIEDILGDYPTDPDQSQETDSTKTSVNPDSDHADTEADPDSQEYPDDTASDTEGWFTRAWDKFNGTYGPNREDAKDGILDPNEVYSYANPTPRERAAAGGVFMGVAAVAPIRAFFGKVEDVERMGAGQYRVKITRGGRTRWVEVPAVGTGMAKIFAHIKSAFS